MRQEKSCGHVGRAGDISHAGVGIETDAGCNDCKNGSNDGDSDGELQDKGQS